MGDELDEDCGTTLEMIQAARQAVVYRRLALAGGPHRERFIRTAIACSSKVGALAEEICANRQAEGLGGSCA